VGRLEVALQRDADVQVPQLVAIGPALYLDEPDP
jgi:hypothetical protein